MKCRFCGRRDGAIVAERVETERHYSVMSTVKTAVVVYQHVECLEAFEAFNTESRERSIREQREQMLETARELGIRLPCEQDDEEPDTLLAELEASLAARRAYDEAEPTFDTWAEHRGER